MSNNSVNTASCQIAVRRFFCPKCKGTDLHLKEVWTGHYVNFDYKNGIILGKGNLECGDPYKVVAFCNNCYHEWRLKGITQISEVS